MSYRIRPPNTGLHKGKLFTQLLIPDPKIHIDGVDVVAVKFEDGWWIVPNGEEPFEDIGPFPTPEVAYVSMKLGHRS